MTKSRYEKSLDFIARHRGEDIAVSSPFRNERGKSKLPLFASHPCVYIPDMAFYG